MNLEIYYVAVAACFSGVFQSVKCQRDPATGEPPALRILSNVAITVGIALLVYGFIRFRWWDPLAAWAIGGLASSFLLGIRNPQLSIYLALATCIIGVGSAVYGLLTA